MNYKQRAVLSSYSDVSKLSSDVKVVHFRKFVSKRILEMVMVKCSDLEEISLSKYASKRLNGKCLRLLSKNKVSVKISLIIGRPNVLETKQVNP